MSICYWTTGPGWIADILSSTIYLFYLNMHSKLIGNFGAVDLIKNCIKNIMFCCKIKNTIQSTTRNYELLDEIGMGSYGKVKLGKDVKSKKKYAIKLV